MNSAKTSNHDEKAIPCILKRGNKDAYFRRVTGRVPKKKEKSLAEEGLSVGGARREQKKGILSRNLSEVSVDESSISAGWLRRLKLPREPAVDQTQ